MTEADNASAAKRGNPRLVFIVLVLLFSAPLLSSWIIFNYTDLIDSGGMQHGDMYDPLVKLPDVELRNPLADEDVGATLYGKWTLLYMNSGACGEDCDFKLYSLRQIRLALSRYARNLQRVWMTDLQDESLLRQALNDYAGTLVLNSRATEELAPGDFAMPPLDDPLSEDAIYVIDPEGYLVLRYREGVEPGGIISDVKRLLKTSSID